MSFSSLKIKTCGVTDIGLVRQNNEDVWTELPDHHCYILADGMGGHQAGEIAARETVKTLTRHLQKCLKAKASGVKELIESIQRAISRVNTHVFKMGRKSPELRGMGTTLCLLHVYEGGVIYAHVGDSRIYRFRAGVLELLTKDHSLIRELMDFGRVDENYAQEYQYKNIITRAIGTEPEVEPTINHNDLHAHDLYILCTDGLSDLLSHFEIEKTLKDTKEISKAALDLITLTKSKGGHDNVTILMIYLMPQPS